MSASRGAPEAIQVADRFHLLQNVREMLQRFLERHETALRAAAEDAVLSAHPAAPSTDDLSPDPEAAMQVLQTTAKSTDSAQQEQPLAIPTLTRAQVQQQARQAARRNRYETVRALHVDGHSQRYIARQLEMSVHTVRRYLVADQFPERATCRSRPSKLDPFIPYLRQQLAAGQDNAMQLWRELCDQFGYSGSRPLVSRWVARHRHLCPSPSPDKPKRRGKPPAPSRPPAKVRRVSARQASWLLVRPPDELDEEERTFVQQLCHHAVGVQLAYPLAQEFIQMVRQRVVAPFVDWLVRLETTGISELLGFAVSLRRDIAAVTAALSLPYSNGQVEGQINRLKLIKRTMYGRASFDLLRKRVLAA